jgi:hypothetical protein
MPAAKSSPKPVALRWVVLAVVVFIAGYTFLRLHYAKRGRPYEPYENGRAATPSARLVALGYRMIPVQIERPTEPLPGARVTPLRAEVVNALGGLPAEMAGNLAVPVDLPAFVTSVTAPRVAGADPYTLQFSCAQTDYRTQIRDVFLYRKDRRLFILPSFEKMIGQLLARSRECVVLASFPTQSLAPGLYTVTLCGDRTSMSWSFVVKSEAAAR